MKTFKEFLDESNVTRDVAGYYVNTATGVRGTDSQGNSPGGPTDRESYEIHKANYEKPNQYKSHKEYSRVRMNKHARRIGEPIVKKGE